MSGLQFLYAAFLRLAALGLILVAGCGLIMPGFAEHAELNLVQRLPDQAIFLAFGLGVFLLVPWWLPQGLRRPSRSFHLIWIVVLAGSSWLATSIMIDIMRTLEQKFGSGIPITPVVELAWISGAMLGALLIGFLVAKNTSPTDHPAPKDPARAMPVKERKPVRLPEKKLPALGAAMKLYIAADWIILRILGLGLMATAYMLWTMIDDGQTFQAEALAHGKDPLTAVYVYGGVGALLGIPFLLPGRIARPKNVGYGLIKAVLLVGAAYVLIVPMDVAIVTFTPDIYHPTLIETVPRLFKAICGIAVTSALLISFFRQLNGLPAVDYKGDAKVTLTAAQLHDLRKARMQG